MDTRLPTVMPFGPGGPGVGPETAAKAGTATVGGARTAAGSVAGTGTGTGTIVAGAADADAATGAGAGTAAGVDE